jgi:endonuclease V-like protein UPF0215 family
MKSGVRALGVADSYRADRATIAGAVVRASRVVDGVGFETCRVGGTDATAALVDLVAALGREDVRSLLLSGIAPAWYNFYDLPHVHEAVERPVISVTFEASDGLEPALREAFAGEALAERLAVYERQPDRRPVEVNGETVYVRAVGLPDDEAAEVVRAFTPEGGRPEPIRVARFAARAGDSLRRGPTGED